MPFCTRSYTSSLIDGWCVSWWLVGDCRVLAGYPTRALSRTQPAPHDVDLPAAHAYGLTGELSPLSVGGHGFGITPTHVSPLCVMAAVAAAEPRLHCGVAGTGNRPRGDGSLGTCWRTTALQPTDLAVQRVASHYPCVL